MKLQLGDQHPGGVVKGDGGSHGAVEAEAGQAGRVHRVHHRVDVDADVVIGLAGVEVVVVRVELHGDEPVVPKDCPPLSVVIGHEARPGPA